ncbi:MAG: transglycosylase SLT domain-containing protein [Nitrobacter sp.]
MTNFSKFGPFLVLVALAWPHPSSAQRAQYESMVAAHAQANGVPVELVHRVIVRESRYNPRAVHRGNYGMMQIKLATARGLGYTGTAEGLLDPETNLTYAVKYLAGAYHAAHGNHNRAVAYYAGGYYYVTKRQRLHDASHEAMSANAQALGAPLFIAPR